MSALVKYIHVMREHFYKRKWSLRHTTAPPLRSLVFALSIPLSALMRHSLSEKLKMYNSNAVAMPFITSKYCSDLTGLFYQCERLLVVLTWLLFATVRGQRCVSRAAWLWGLYGTSCIGVVDVCAYVPYGNLVTMVLIGFKETVHRQH